MFLCNTVDCPSDAWLRFLAKEEEIVPPYRFKVYDLLVLPPSFPYGGMVRKSAYLAALEAEGSL